MRAASPALQEWWPDGKEPADHDSCRGAHDGESPRSWRGVKWSGDRVQELDFCGSKLEVLAPEIGQLQALTSLHLIRQRCFTNRLLQGARDPVVGGDQVVSSECGFDSP